MRIFNWTGCSIWHWRYHSVLCALCLRMEIFWVLLFSLSLSANPWRSPYTKASASRVENCTVIIWHSDTYGYSQRNNRVCYIARLSLNKISTVIFGNVPLIKKHRTLGKTELTVSLRTTHQVYIDIYFVKAFNEIIIAWFLCTWKHNIVWNCIIVS